MNLHYSVVLTLICLVSSLKCVFASNYGQGDSLYVLSTNGLYLREGPIQNTAKIGVIKYGQKIYVLDVLGWEKKQRISNLNGHWIKVKVNGLEGYMLDTYLSKMKPPTSPLGLSKYVEKYIGFQDPDTKHDNNNNWSRPLMNSDTLKFEQYYEAAARLLVSSQMRVEEAYALGRAIIESWANSEASNYVFSRTDFSYDNHGNLIRVFHQPIQTKWNDGIIFTVEKLKDGRVSLKIGAAYG